MRLAIVGSRSLDGNPEALRVIRDVLDAYQARHPVPVIISGGAVGIDRMAAAEARRRGLQVIEHLPKGRSWRHYRERNVRIVEDCDELVRIADPCSRSYGSGWTRDRAREFGRPTFEYTRSPTGRRRPWGARPASCEGAMPDRHFTIDGYLVADAEIPSSGPGPDTGHRGRLLLFGNERGWTLLTIHHAAIWGEHGPTDGFTTGCVTTYSDPATLRFEHPHSFWVALVDAAARNGVDLQNPAPPLEDL